MRISDWSSDVCSSDLPILPSTSAIIFSFYAISPLFPARHLDHPNVGYLGDEIGRASCRESVSVRVDLGGRRLIKKKNKSYHISQQLQSQYIKENISKSLEQTLEPIHQIKNTTA